MQLTQQGRNFFPTWSPNGQWILYSQNICTDSTPCGTWRISESGTDQQFLVQFGIYAEWINNTVFYYLTTELKPNGEVIGSRIWKMDLSNWGRETVNVIEKITRHLDYSPRNEKFTLSQPPTVIWTLTLDGNLENKLSSNAELASHGAWSPDGEHIVYTNPAKENGYLWIMDKDGSNKKQLTF